MCSELPSLLDTPGIMVGSAPSPIPLSLSMILSPTPVSQRFSVSKMTPITVSSLQQGQKPQDAKYKSKSEVFQFPAKLKPLEQQCAAKHKHILDKKIAIKIRSASNIVINTHPTKKLKRRLTKKRLISSSVLDTGHCGDVTEDVDRSEFLKSKTSLTKLPKLIIEDEEVLDTLCSSSVEEIDRELSDLSVTESQPVPPKSKPPLQKRISVLSAIKPENQDSERQRFFCCNFHYNPTFLYRGPITAPMMEKFGSASDRLLPLAVKIMENALRRHGSYEEFERKTGGRQLSRAQIMEAAKSYLTAEGLENEVEVQLVDDLVSRACMSRVKGRPTLRVRTSNMREHWMIGMLRHELGTHYLRSCNNRHQIWHKWRLRNDLELEPVNPTEEGLASLHSVLFREDPCLWRCALLYYTIHKASQLSFSDLFQDLSRFLVDPNVRWDYCLRAKRGQTETSGPGAFCKDQVYLEGALQLLKHRRTLDFHALVKLGKISYLDINRLRLLGNYKNARIPSFMEDLPHYLNSLQDILTRNGLTDDDLIDV